MLAEPASPLSGREAVNAFLGDGRRWLPSLANHGSPGWADPFRASVVAKPDGPVLEWPAILGETYRVEASERLTDPVWMVLEQDQPSAMRSANGRWPRSLRQQLRQAPTR